MAFALDLLHDVVHGSLTPEQAEEVGLLHIQHGEWLKADRVPHAEAGHERWAHVFLEQVEGWPQHTQEVTP